METPAQAQAQTQPCNDLHSPNTNFLLVLLLVILLHHTPFSLSISPTHTHTHETHSLSLSLSLSHTHTHTHTHTQVLPCSVGIYFHPLHPPTRSSGQKFQSPKRNNNFEYLRIKVKCHTGSSDEASDANITWDYLHTCRSCKRKGRMLQGVPQRAFYRPMHARYTCCAYRSTL